MNPKLAILACFLVSACGGQPFTDLPSDSPDSGTVDTGEGTTDSGTMGDPMTVESGTLSPDSATSAPDSGDPIPDAETADSGPIAPEAGHSPPDAGPAPTEANALAECQAYALVHTGGICWGDWRCTLDDGGFGPVMMCYASNDGNTCVGQCWGFVSPIEGEVLSCNPCGKEIGIW
jgi:hypothetical protein